MTKEQAIGFLAQECETAATIAAMREAAKGILAKESAIASPAKKAEIEAAVAGHAKAISGTASNIEADTAAKKLVELLK